MLILSHRGYWTFPAEKNTASSFQRSFDAGFGLETDVRDALGQLVVSHDPPRRGDDVLSFSDFLDLYISAGGRDRDLPLALNVKADGLSASIASKLEARHITAAFVFDMSVPDMRGHIAAGHPVFARQSDVECHPAFYAESAGVWMDSFASEGWLTGDVVRRHLDAGKRVCIVSGELHGREPLSLWQRLRAELGAVRGDERLMLCTDLPQDAADFFDRGAT
jgi:hypothetical protein